MSAQLNRLLKQVEDLQKQIDSIHVRAKDALDDKLETEHNITWRRNRNVPPPQYYSSHDHIFRPFPLRYDLTKPIVFGDRNQQQNGK